MTPEAAETLADLIRQTNEFLAGPTRFPSISQEFNGKRHRVYLRKGYVAFKEVIPSNAFCIASIEFDPDVQGQGIFTEYLEFVLPLSFELIVVECVNNPVLVPVMERHGFSVDHLRTTNYGRMKPGITGTL